MPNLNAKIFAKDTERLLHSHEGLTHLRVRARGKVLTLVSGPADDPVPHARLRQQTVHYWTLEMPARGGRWERTGLRDTRENLITALVEQFGWVLTPVTGNPERTSDPEC